MIKRRKPLRRGKRTSARKKSRMALRKECDRRFALAIKARDGWRCVMCGRTQGVQCAHLISRRYHATRWMLGNAVTLCASCHLGGHMDPLRFEDWCVARLGEAGWAELRAIARRGTPWVDYEAVLKTLPKEGV